MSAKGQARTAPGRGVVGKVWGAAALTAVVFVAALALVTDRASRVADAFSLDAERRMVVLDLQRQADEAVRQVNNVANWDELVEAVSKADKPDMAFVEDEVANWITKEIGYAFAAAVDDAGVARFAAVDGSLLWNISGLRQVTENADLVALARQRYEERRVQAEEGYFVAYDNGDDTPRIDAWSWRMFAGKPAMVVAQVIIPETQELALEDGEALVLIAAKLLDAESLASLGVRLGFTDPQVVPLRDAAGEPAAAPMGPEGAATLALKWSPRAPRSEIIVATAPFALGLCAVFLAAMIYIVGRHSAALAQLSQSEEENRFLATQDTLTRLANRAQFDRELGGAFDRLEKSAFAVLCIDLDKFKAVNDTHGHNAGDAVLREVAARFRARIAERGLVARTGGDEFIALVHHVTGFEALLDMAKGFIEDASTPVYFNGTLLQIGASVGIAVAPNDGRNPRDIIHAADMALYAAKAEGRGTARPAGGEWKPGENGVTTRAVA